MSLYHETAEILLAAGTSGGSLRTLTYGKKGLKSPPAQVYALAVESARWSGVLKEVVEASEILKFERKVSGHARIIYGEEMRFARLVEQSLCLSKTHRGLARSSLISKFLMYADA